MAKREYVSKYFRITHTVEEEGPHPTIPYDYYDDTYAITAYFRGEGICYIEGNRHPIFDGVIVTMSPEEIRSFHHKQTGYHERISLYFSGSILHPFWDYELPLLQVFHGHLPGEDNCYAPGQYDEKTVQPILEALRDIVENSGIAMKESRGHLLILQLLFALYDGGMTEVAPSIGYMEDEKIAQICSYIKEHLTEDLSYTHLQEHFLVSRYQLTQVFGRNTGMTLTEYIIHKRLMHAMSLIRKGEGMERAAYEAGFHTYSHFYKAFKKRYRTSPNLYFKKK